MSTALAALQEDFLRVLLDGGEMTCAVEPSDAIAFYRASVDATWCTALSAAYPVVERLVGEAFFGEASRLYARRNPSASGDLHRFGDRFAEFLEQYAPAAGLEYLPDVARLEWGVHECAHAADNVPFDFATLSMVPEDAQGHLVARLAAAVRWLHSRHPIVAIYEANRPESDGVPDRLEGPDAVLVRRRDGDVVVERIDPAAYAFLEALGRGRDLDESSRQLADGVSRLPDLLARWIDEGVIQALVPRASRG